MMQGEAAHGSIPDSAPLPIPRTQYSLSRSLRARSAYCGVNTRMGCVFAPLHFVQSVLYSK